MHTLLLKLAGPLQAWGVESKFIQRATNTEPTKSGITGLIASALGRGRDEPLNELSQLAFAIRTDQPGRLVRDYQTAIDWKATSQKDRNPKLSTRYYLSDAIFVVALGGKPSFLEQLERALRNPRYPLFLGRRSCPANVDLVIGIREGTPADVLRKEPWQAAIHHQKSQPRKLSLPLHRDAEPGELGDRQRDVPVSFSQAQRVHTWRDVVLDEPISIDNPLGYEQRDSFFETVAQA